MLPQDPQHIDYYKVARISFAHINQLWKRWCKHQQTIVELAKIAKQMVKFNVRGKIFNIVASALETNEWFSAMLSRWQPDLLTHAFFIDARASIVKYIFEYLRTNKFPHVPILLRPHVFKLLDYFCLPTTLLDCKSMYKFLSFVL